MLGNLRHHVSSSDAITMRLEVYLFQLRQLEQGLRQYCGIRNNEAVTSHNHVTSA